MLRTVSMNLNNVYVRFFSACIIISFIITCLMALLPIGSSGIMCDDNSPPSIH